MIKINGKVYEGNSLLIDKHGNVIIDGVLQGSIKEPKIDNSLNKLEEFLYSPLEFMFQWYDDFNIWLQKLLH